MFLSGNLHMPNGMCCTRIERHLINGHHGDAITNQFIMAQSSEHLCRSLFLYIYYDTINMVKESDPDTVHMSVYCAQIHFERE